MAVSQSVSVRDLTGRRREERGWACWMKSPAVNLTEGATAETWHRQLFTMRPLSALPTQYHHQCHTNATSTIINVTLERRSFLKFPFMVRAAWFLCWWRSKAGHDVHSANWTIKGESVNFRGHFLRMRSALKHSLLSGPSSGQMTNLLF